MFRLIFGLPWLIVLLRFLQPLPWPLSVKILAAVVLLVASQYHFISFLSSGSVFSPEFPRPLIIAFNIVLGALILLAVLLLALDAVSLVLRIWKGHFPVVPATLRYALALLALGVSSFAVSQAIRVPTVKTFDVAIAGLPAEFEGYRLLQLTDLHISRLFPKRWTEAVVARSNALEADLIVITGDFIDGSVASRQLDIAPLSDLRARDGVYAIPGNHEYFFEHDQWMKHLSGLGLTFLENSHTVIDRRGAQITLAGVTDFSAPRSGLPPPDLAAALQGAPAGAPVILLDHQPRMANSAAQAGVALQLSGHTHGGMVIGLDRLVARANNGFVSGLYAVDAMQLYVNNGTALWPGFALRLGIPSELTVITLRRA